jgi:hypothetical protein
VFRLIGEAVLYLKGVKQKRFSDNNQRGGLALPSSQHYFHLDVSENITRLRFTPAVLKPGELDSK